MSEIRIGLIGYGYWTRNAYLPALRRDGRAAIVSAAAPSVATRQLIRSEIGPDVTVCDGFEALLAGPRVDAVMIAVPDAMHEVTLCAALDAGMPVLYEPPVAQTRAHIDPMLRRLLAAPQITHADLELRYLPSVGRVAELIRGGTLGRIQTVSIRLCSAWGLVPDYDLCSFHRLCPWYVDVLNHILDTTPRRVLVLDGHGLPGRRQRTFIAHLDYDGVWGTFSANLATVGDLEAPVEVTADDGDISVNTLTGEVRLRSRLNPDWVTEQWPAVTPDAGWPGTHESVGAFLDAVQSSQASANDATAVARLHSIGLAAEVSVDSGAWAEVPDLSTGSA